MRDILGESLEKSNRIKVRKTRMTAVLLALSVIVSLDVFWLLRQPGLTLAGDADCGIVEHTHDELCQSEESPCSLEEHVHDILCYSDDTADTETPLDWQEMFADYPYTGNLGNDLAGIAKTQVGYSESTLNFSIGADGVRRGYTRYGAWYGTPYMDWSAAFVSFCLNYAGADPGEFPGNTGAVSMAETWKNIDKYTAAGEYIPSSGDLVFFDNNTVGIVSEISGSTLYVIRGDVENSVTGCTISLSDSSITGWGMIAEALANEPEKETEDLSDAEKIPEEDFNTEEKNEEQEEIPEHETLPEDYLFDISDGPAFFIFEGASVPKQTKSFSLKSARTIKEVASYLEANGGTYFFTLWDNDNHELPKDGSGNYIVEPNALYKLTISFSSPNGFVPGTYQYQIPNGLTVEGGEGTFVLTDGVNVGNWSVTDEGLITLNFNEHMNSRTEITISSTFGVYFPESETPIDFDGKISVTVQKPTDDKEHTEISKWGEQGNAENQNNPNSNKIYWSVLIKGHGDSNIVGSVLTDNTVSGEWLGDHKYTASDIAGGLTFGVSETDPETQQEIDWHRWTVSPDDPNLTWTETGWSYKIPEKAVCEWCGEIAIGNDGWNYTVRYTSTPLPSNVAGSMGYMNQVKIEDEIADGWASFVQGDVHGEISKNGSFISDAGGGSFLWELQVVIPGLAEGQIAEYNWFVMDYMDIRDNNGNIISYITNDANKSIVTATHNGTTVNVPEIYDATASDPFAWHNYWSSDRNGVLYGRQINLVCRCNCTEKNCKYWNNGTCGSEYSFTDRNGNWISNGFCYCWTTEGNTTFTLAYKTEDLSLIEKYGGLGYKLRNESVLHNRPNGSGDGVVISTAQDSVVIPGLFSKEITQDFDGYTAHYRITVNEGKLALTNGTPLNIHDVMTETLVYISGSLVITAEDANGNITKLKQGTDYTVNYDGTGESTDPNGNPLHLLDVVILHPQPVMYILDYDTTLTIPNKVTEAVKYTNSASITLWDKKITDTTTEKVYANINIAARNYKVEMFKTCALSGNPLGGATFGLYNAQGGLITTGITDENGKLLFQSNLIEGIVLHEHVLYYMQEIKAPPGYELDDTKFWFCFCNEQNSSCQTCIAISGETNAQRIPSEQIGKVHAENQIINYNLPVTGGTGVYPLKLVSVIFIITPLVYKLIQKRKRERRESG